MDSPSISRLERRYNPKRRSKFGSRAECLGSATDQATGGPEESAQQIGADQN
jgi:hypothetical protein